ncbi:hypothetical protein AMATHDRAFT_1892 [Amanita thiersii Skay4041]|uniref:Sec63-domain-containing protein n=1 Tax=Amanita thiersii Skay4041 TaxID=703135 RepID=A0A2A9NY57_9AGAR|nr:hypothetical protein AMATHDRAFT_1892 [Amanita thiersii Skay4041]
MVTSSDSEFLQTLITASRDDVDDKDAVANWKNIQKNLGDKAVEGDAVVDYTFADGIENAWISVLDEYHFIDGGTPLYFSNISRTLPLHQLLRQTHFEHLSDSLITLLSSSKSNDQISEELVEMVGFDNIELATDIITQRSIVLKELLGSPTNNPDVPTYGSLALSVDEARKRIEDTYRQNAARPLFTGAAHDAPENHPHVYTSSSLAQGNLLSHLGSKYMLPIGTIQTRHEDYEEFVVPPAKLVPPKDTERIVPISELNYLVRGCFPGYVSLNRMQSIVHPTAYGTNENLLVCAPTGAGKTDVAILTILRVIDQHLKPAPDDSPLHTAIDKQAFKVIYVAPMKALAAEIVRKLDKRLRWLGIRVQELTGDMQMSKAEIAQTQIIVTTPEKWDVVTRKPTGEGEIASILKLLIIDEVHLLNDERGAVIETIVARTLRQVESSQSVIRIVGLSATLPNYLDVAEFLSVSRQRGLFYFDSSFRPVPLEQHFLGIKGKPGSSQSRRNFDRVTFQKVSELVAQGHQVMVFVHARKETVKTAMALMEAATTEGSIDDFSCTEHPQWELYRRNMGESRNKEMKRLFDNGFGIHHAGMLRSDRTLTEKAFHDRAIKVLCCTATLAWGVNLPAHAVIIKGTQVYDSSKGTFVDLSVLDVLQIFGRAGRPGLETSGEGYICTTEDKLSHYLDAVLSQIPIESQFQKGLVDALNAEIALGTVSTVHDAVRWLGYTYLFVRMRKNPFNYGISLEDDPSLGHRRTELAIAAAGRLAATRMIVYDSQRETFHSTDLGRIAARYYIRHASIEIFNNKFRQRMSEADVLAMLSLSTEFDQLQVRENEIKELERVMASIPCDVKGGAENVYGKVNILLQGYISREIVEDFALVSDTAYVAQNAGRIIRALFEIAVSKKWADLSSVLLDMSKAVELRMWPFEHPLKQFNLKKETMDKLERWAGDWSINDLAISDAQAVGELVHLNSHHGQAIINAAKQFPSIQLSYELQPLSPDILKVTVHACRSFTWNSKLHGQAEMFMLWIQRDDKDSSIILQLTHMIIRPTSDLLQVDFIISVPSKDVPLQLTLRSASEHWIGADEELEISLDSIIMPIASELHTRKLDLPFLSASTFGVGILGNIFNHISTLNNIQTQVYWSLVRTKNHTLLCGPGGSGKSTMAQMAVWTTVLNKSRSWILVITPSRSVAAELLSSLGQAGNLVDVSVEFKTKANVLRPPRGKAIYIVTAMHLYLAFCQSTSHMRVPGIDLVVCENLEQLNSSYELAISLLRHATQSSPTRFIGISNSLNDPHDLADWLGVGPYALHSFKPSDRDQSLVNNASPVSIPFSSSLFKALSKQVHDAIKGAETAIVFVPTQNHCKSVALDLLTQCALEFVSTRGYLPNSIGEDLLQLTLDRLQGSPYHDFMSKGVGFFHGGLDRQDRHDVLELFAEGIIRVLLVPHDACWAIPVRAEVVVVMGCQCFQYGAEGSNPQIRDYSLTEIMQMQSRAVRNFGEGHFVLFCPPEAKDTYTRFLNNGLPLESRLLEEPELDKWLKLEMERKKSFDKQQIVEALSFTYLARRIGNNPSYYGCVTTSRDENLSRVVDRLMDKERETESLA